MTIPVAKPYPSGEGVEYPRNMYFFDNATNDEIVILEEQQHDPRVILLAQLRNCLFVPYRQTFKTNVPEVVYVSLPSLGEVFSNGYYSAKMFKYHSETFQKNCLYFFNYWQFGKTLTENFEKPKNF